MAGAGTGLPLGSQCACVLPCPRRQPLRAGRDPGAARRHLGAVGVASVAGPGAGTSPVSEAAGVAAGRRHLFAWFLLLDGSR